MTTPTDGPTIDVLVGGVVEERSVESVKPDRFNPLGFKPVARPGEQIVQMACGATYLKAKMVCLAVGKRSCLTTFFRIGNLENWPEKGLQMWNQSNKDPFWSVVLLIIVAVGVLIFLYT